jgi:hypothetical protein
MAGYFGMPKIHSLRGRGKWYSQTVGRCGLNLACPTNGSDRGSLRDHDLSLIASRLGVSTSGCYDWLDRKRHIALSACQPLQLVTRFGITI